MTPNDEMLMAYADEQLAPAERARVEAALATQPALAARVEHLRRQRRQLQQAYAGVLDEPVPETLLAALAAPVEAARVVALDAARRPPAPARPRWRTALAMAAALALGIALGRGLVPAGSGSMFRADAAGLLASGPLRDALEHRLGDEAVAADAVRLPLSFRSSGGSYCRAFVLPRQRHAGLACRDAGQWRVNALEDAAATDAQGLRMAASALPEGVLRAVDARIAGESLDAQGERRARDQGWR